jgi:hypothetical protein
MAIGQKIWHTTERIVVFTHVAGMAVSAATWFVAQLAKLDRSLIVGSEIGFLYCLLILTATFIALHWGAWMTAYREARRKRKLRNWTDRGLDWRVLPESHQQLPDGRMTAILSIASAPGGELPQPLDLVVTCAGNIAEAASAFHFDPSRPEEIPISGDVEIDTPRDGRVELRLVSPKLLPPARWDLRLVSAGNAAVRVVDVRRAPRKGEA